MNNPLNVHQYDEALCVVYAAAVFTAIAAHAVYFAWLYVQERRANRP